MSDLSEDGALDIDVPATLIAGDGAPTKGAAGDDTTKGTAAGDSLAGGAAGDTTTGAAGADTLAGAGAIEKPAARPARTAAVDVEPDEVDRELEAAIKTVKDDPAMSEGEKAKAIAELNVTRSDRMERRRASAGSAVDDAWDAAVAQHGLPREVLEGLWEAEGNALIQKGFRGASLQGALLVAFEHRIAAEKAKAPPPVVDDKADKAKKAGQRHVTRGGAAVIPPGGGGGGGAEIPKPASPEDEFAKLIKDAGGVFDPSEK